MLEFFGGIFMAFGGNIPGVSGGTIAFLMGFYDRLINSINAFVSKLGGQGKDIRKKAFFFLLRLLVGYVIGLIGGAFLVNKVFEAHIYKVSSFFIGITFASVPVVAYEERETLKSRKRDVLWTFVGIAAIVGITLLSKAKLFGGNSDWGQIVLAFPAGLLAACAMIVPGVSGAAFFYVFGLYLPINRGIESFVKLVASLFTKAEYDFDVMQIPLLCSVGVGAIVGLLCVIKGVRWLLMNKRSQTVYAILGLMLGSIYSIWVGPEILKTPQPAITLDSFSILFFILGVILIVAFEGAKILISKKRAGSPDASPVSPDGQGSDETKGS